MDPISISLEIDLGALLLAGVGAIATWIRKRNREAAHRQRERHHAERLALERLVEGSGRSSPKEPRREEKRGI